MASWTRRKRTTVEYLLPRNSNAADFDQAWRAAAHDWEELEWKPNAPPGMPGRPPDWCQIDADDENVIIRVSVERGEATP